MRLGVGLALLALAAACSEARFEQARSDMGCAPVDGLKQLSRNTPDYIIVGEFTETMEAPAAFAELACNLAASGEPLFVGVSDYLGGATAAEKEMRARLEALKAKGAPITIASVDDGNRPYDTRARTKSEKAWADAIAAQVKASGAVRALLLVSHTDARNAAWPRGERFAGYDPMPMHLDGEVLSLEIGTAPAIGLKTPTLRLYPEKTNGFSGQIALASLTRPGIELALASTAPATDSPRPFGPLDMSEVEAVLNSDLTRLEKIDRLTVIFDRELQDNSDWRSDRLGQSKDLGPRPELRRQAARRMATGMVDRRTPSLREPPSNAPQFQLDDASPPAPPPQIQLPDFEATDDTP